MNRMERMGEISPQRAQRTQRGNREEGRAYDHKGWEMDG